MTSFKEKISTKVKNKYRLILRQDENLEEKVSLVLTPLNILLVASVGLMVFGTVIFLLLAYTPLNNILPSYSNKFSNAEQYELLNRIDSLETNLRYMNQKAEVLNTILSSGETVEYAESVSDAGPTEPATSIEPATSQRPVNSGVKLPENPSPKNYSFYVPVKGVISDTFNIERKHLAVDIAAKDRDVIKSIQRGTVIYSAWNPKTGHSIIIQHPNEFVSVYRHNSVLLKKEGTFVKAGEAIALVGSTGELTTGPHCHFELWNRGIAVDPQKYISF
jgi:murein DD-endopeptidase MepM/ murein hydrolase activator NlpD